MRFSKLALFRKCDAPSVAWRANGSLFNCPLKCERCPSPDANAPQSNNWSFPPKSRCPRRWSLPANCRCPSKWRAPRTNHAVVANGRHPPVPGPWLSGPARRYGPEGACPASRREIHLRPFRCAGRPRSRVRRNNRGGARFRRPCARRAGARASRTSSRSRRQRPTEQQSHRTAAIPSGNSRRIPPS